MKRIFLVLAVSCLLAPAVLAQEHFTEGPVWECGAYRTTPGHFDDYMTYLRHNLTSQAPEAKKAGLFIDQKVFIKTPQDPDDADVVICTLYASFGKALDYNAADDTKAKDLSAKFYKTADEAKQREMTAHRLEYRTYIGTSYYREVNLRPAP